MDDAMLSYYGASELTESITTLCLEEFARLDVRQLQCLSLMVEQPNTVARPSALRGITRNAAQYDDTIYII